MILNDLEDIEKALKFVKERQDEELWEVLIDRGAKDPKSLSKLLDTAGSHIDPIVIIERIPDKLEIPDLRDKIVKIIKDYTAQMSLHEGCGRVLKSDNVELCRKAAKERTRAGVWGMQQGVSASTAPATRRNGEGRWTPNGDAVPMAAGKRGAGPSGGSATWYFHVGAAGGDDDDDDGHGGVSSPRVAPGGVSSPRVRPGGALYTSSRGGTRSNRDGSERRRVEQAHHRTVAARGGAAAGLFYFDEGGIQDRLRGPGYNPAEGKMYANAVLGLKPLTVGPSGDQEKVERHEIARLAGWSGQLQLMEEQRAREKAAALAVPPVGVGSAASGQRRPAASSAAAGAAPPPVFSPPPPIASQRDFLRVERDDEKEMDPVARADAMMRGDSVYSELESKYRSV